VLVRTLAALAGGLLLSLAFEPVAVAYVAPVALAVFALSTRGLRARSGWVPGLAFGAAFYFVHIFWMREAIATEAWIALASLEAAFYGVLGSAAAALHRLRAWPAWLACAWTTMEVVRMGWPFSGMPWGRVGFSVVDTPFAPLLAWVGTNGVTFVVAATGFLLAALVVARERLAAATALVVVVTAALGPVLLPYDTADAGDVTVALVQGNVPGRGNDVLADVEGLTRNHVDATVALARRVDRASGPGSSRGAADVPRPDFVVWPENSTATDPFRDREVNEGIERAVDAVGVPILVGAMVDEGPDHVLNQGIVWDPETGPGERYAKRNPVTFGEYIPFRGLVRWLGLEETGQLGRIGRDMVAGDRREPLSIAGVDVADAICFDVAYDDNLSEQVENGAELFVVQSSNASFIFTDQVDQQFAITRARAIEYGRWTVVATTNGTSGVISPDGEVVTSTDRRVQAVLVERVGLRSGVPPGVGVSQTLAWLAPALTVVGLLLVAGPGLVRRRRIRGSAG
jgi:apolipoprotein N-acyltransferase